MFARRPQSTGEYCLVLFGESGTVVASASRRRWGGVGGWLYLWWRLSRVHILTLCGSERVLVVSTEPPDDLSCLTTPEVGRPGDGPLPVPLTRCIQMHTPSPCGGLPTPALPCARWGCASAG